MARYLLAGASGLIGTSLADSLRADGHQVVRLVRRAASAPDERRWDPAAGLLDAAALDGVDGVVCLSGAGVGEHRWTDDYKRLILSSRVDSVGTLANAVAGRAVAGRGGQPLFVAASAVGYYGHRGDEEVDERTPAGDTFLSEVCVEWEAAADPARQAGVRVAHLRTGLVLSRAGGLLQRLALVVKAGVGGKLGDGRQFMPWISLRDEVAAIRFLLEHDVDGPVNLTAPHPVRNAEFVKTLGDVLHRPTLFRVPGSAARLVLGEFAGEVLTGQRALPRRLLDAGFTFRHTDLESALRAELG